MREKYFWKTTTKWRRDWRYTFIPMNQTSLLPTHYCQWTTNQEATTRVRSTSTKFFQKVDSWPMIQMLLIFTTCLSRSQDYGVIRELEWKASMISWKITCGMSVRSIPFGTEVVELTISMLLAIPSGNQPWRKQVKSSIIPSNSSALPATLFLDISLTRMLVCHRFGLEMKSSLLIFFLLRGNS